MAANKTAVVTTSWDDGHPLDLRVAELLATYGVKGTFYVPIHYAAIPRMSCVEILELRRIGMEIGSHTMTHPRLHRLSDDVVLRELTESKSYLEDLLGEPVTAFCYPEGKFTPRQIPLVQQAGYKLARTTMGFRTGIDFEPHLMPVSMQFWRHPRHILLRHELMQQNFRGALDWLRLWGAEKDLTALAQAMLGHIGNVGGMFHIWGHSWEIEAGGLWTELEDTLKLISDFTSVVCSTNSEVLEAPMPYVTMQCLTHA
jgi:peptidoglycan/xylan/chitin deacetylase (PgdA/CDA1 family)